MSIWVATVFATTGAKDVFTLPVRKITARQVVNEIGLRQSDIGDRLIGACCAECSSHRHDSVLAKMRVINAVAKANVTAVPPLVDAMMSWARENNGLRRLISEGSPKRAQLFMEDVAKTRKRSYTSAISKYLAFHNPARWPIYDEWVRKYLWAVVLTIDMGQMKDANGAVIEVKPGWSRLQDVDSLKNYQTYVGTLNMIWNMLKLPTRNVSTRDKDYALWRLGKTRSVPRNGRSKSAKLRKAQNRT